MKLPVVARHEAGHAVAAWYFGYPIDFVTIEPVEDFASRWIASPVDREDSAPETVVEPEQYVKVLQAIDVCFAGHEADAVFTGRQNWGGSRRDRQIAIDLASYLCGPSEEIAALFNWRRIRTRGFVVKYTAEIDVVAEALLERTRLTGNEVRVAINSALARRSTPPHVENKGSR